MTQFFNYSNLNLSITDSNSQSNMDFILKEIIYPNTKKHDFIFHLKRGIYKEDRYSQKVLDDYIDNEQRSTILDHFTPDQEDQIDHNSDVIVNLDNSETETNQDDEDIEKEKANGNAYGHDKNNIKENGNAYGHEKKTYTFNASKWLGKFD